MIGLSIDQVQITQNRNKKMDILLYNSIGKARKSYVYRLVLHILKLILLCVFLAIDVTALKSNRTLIIVFMGVAIGIVAMNSLITLLIIIFGYGNYRKNNQFFVKVAAKLDHVATGESISDLDYDDIQNCVSKTLYNKNSNMENDNQGLTDQIRNRYEGIYCNLVDGQVLEVSACLSQLERLCKFSSFSLLIFGIVALSIGSPSSQEIGVLVTFLVLQMLNVWVTIIVLCIIAISPLIICVLCFFCCCCMKEVGELNIPESVEATAAIIEKTDGTCSICFQTFLPAEKVTILRCSDRHVFHTGCLGNWLRVSHTCPLCRKDVNEPGGSQ